MSNKPTIVAYFTLEKQTFPLICINNKVIAPESWLIDRLSLLLGLVAGLRTGDRCVLEVGEGLLELLVLS